MERLDMFISGVTSLLIFGFLFGAIMVGLGAFKTSMTASSAEANAVGNVITFGGNFAAQLPTVGTVLGALVIVAVILAVFAGGYIAYKKVV